MLLGPTSAQNLTIPSLANPEKFSGCTITQNLTTLASAIPEIFKDMHNLKVGHVTLTTLLSGVASYRQAVTCYDKPTHQI